jgi:hypothetical protein
MRLDLATSRSRHERPGNYGITVDQNGIAWFGGHGLFRCDFDVGGNCEGKFGEPLMSGVAVDGEGQIWARRRCSVYKFDNDRQAARRGPADGAPTASPSATTATRASSATTAPSAVAAGAVGRPPGAVHTYYTGHKGEQPALVDNYTYTDFTGFGAQNVTVTKGEWTVRSTTAAKTTSSGPRCLFNLEPEGKIPVGTSLTFQIRAANVKADLEATPWVIVEGNLPTLPVTGRFYELRARLVISDQDIEESPVLSDVCVLKKE